MIITRKSFALCRMIRGKGQTPGYDGSSYLLNTKDSATCIAISARKTWSLVSIIVELNIVGCST